VVQHTQRLVEKVFVEVALLFKITLKIRGITPDGPMVLGKNDVGLINPTLYGFI